MRVLHVSTSDRAGGAEKVAYDLFRLTRKRGHQASLAVGFKTINDPAIFEIPNDAYRKNWARVWRRAQSAALKNNTNKLARAAGWLANLGELERWWEWQRGFEDFSFPGTDHLFNLIKDRPDVIHLHNLHGGYFDLRRLVEFSHKNPVFFTLHDEWAFTGHCAYTFGCERWEAGCGECPNLGTYPAVRRDNTPYNWQRKRDIYSRSKLYVSAPSQWLLDKALRSILRSSIAEAKVIPYGIDLEIFRPGNKQIARKEFNIPQEAWVVLFVANKTRSNPYKDYVTLEATVRQIAAKNNGRDLIFLCVGEVQEDYRDGAVWFRFLGYQGEPSKLAQLYSASDVFLHAAHTDNFPNTILESLACGTPVIATAVGGIPEQIEDGCTGFLVPPRDSTSMSMQCLRLLNDVALRQQMSAEALIKARLRFDLERQVDEYLSWYQEVLQRHESSENLHHYSFI